MFVYIQNKIDNKIEMPVIKSNDENSTKFDYQLLKS